MKQFYPGCGCQPEKTARKKEELGFLLHGCFLKCWYPKMDGLMEHPIKMDDLGVPLFLETPT